MTLLSQMQINAARSAFCNGYDNILSQLKSAVTRTGHSIHVKNNNALRCYNVHDASGTTDEIVRFGFLDEDIPDTLCVQGKSGCIYPVGTDINGQDNFTLSNPLVLLDSI